MKPIPTYSPDLINQLDELYPERSPRITDKDREIWMQAGERRLVRALKDRLEHTEQKQIMEI